MSTIGRFSGSIPTICAGCQRLAGPNAFTPNRQGKGPFIWWCDECQKMGRDSAEKVYNMPARKMELWEGRANEEAAEKAGSYLDEIGQTDLSKLSEVEWKEFWRRFVVGREQTLRRMIFNNEAPF